MSTAPAKLMTSEEFWQLPDNDGVERWLVRGELRERFLDEESDMSRRSPQHANATAVLTALLYAWCQSQSDPRPRVFNGDAYFRLQSNPDTNVGIDVAVATPEQVSRLKLDDRFIDGPPLLAIEVISSSDKAQEIYDKLRSYLVARTPVVWIVNPFVQTVTAYRPGKDPVLFTQSQELTSEPELPGFRCPVAELFRIG